MIWTFSYVCIHLSEGGKQARSGHNHPVILKITIFVVNLDKMVLGYSATITTFTISATTSTAFTTTPHLIPEKDALDIIRAKSNNKIKRLLPKVWLLFWPLYSENSLNIFHNFYLVVYTFWMWIVQVCNANIIDSFSYALLWISYKFF